VGEGPFHVTSGGLTSYGPDVIGVRRSHPQGQKPADLPVQAPTKYRLAINLFLHW
jgi:hypothetical protein